MKVLLTGGAGFIGSHVADALLAAGHEVVIVDDLSTGTPANIPSGARFYLLNICSEELEKVFKLEKPDIVDHHAAQISVTVSARDPVRDARINAMGLLNVLECCRASKVRKLIFISSGGAIYGEAGEEKLTEDHPALPLSPYAIHKQLGESYLRFYASAHGLTVHRPALRERVRAPAESRGRGGRGGHLHLPAPAGGNPRRQRLPRGARGHVARLRVRRRRGPGEHPRAGQGRRAGREHLHGQAGPHAGAPGRDLPDHGQGAALHARFCPPGGPAIQLPGQRERRRACWGGSRPTTSRRAWKGPSPSSAPMPDASQAQIGILPCPGGMAFAQKIYSHLESITKDKFEERIRSLSRSYQLPRTEIIRQMNLTSDMMPSSVDFDEPIDQLPHAQLPGAGAVHVVSQRRVQDGDPLLGAQHRRVRRAGRLQPLPHQLSPHAISPRSSA